MSRGDISALPGRGIHIFGTTLANWVEEGDNRGVRHVPIEQRSMTRLAMSLIAWTVLPGALIVFALCIAAEGFLSSFTDFVTHLPVLF